MQLAVSRQDAAGWGHADGVLCSANVPRAAYGRSSSLISLRKTHHQRGLPAQRLIRLHNAMYPVQRASGGLCSEIKEEPKAGDIRGRGYPVASAHPLNPGQAI